MIELVANMLSELSNSEKARPFVKSLKVIVAEQRHTDVTSFCTCWVSPTPIQLSQEMFRVCCEDENQQVQGYQWARVAESSMASLLTASWSIHPTTQNFQSPCAFYSSHLGILNYFVVVTISATATVQLNLLTEDAGFLTQGQQWILSLNFYKETYEGKVRAMCFWKSDFSIRLVFPGLPTCPKRNI